MDLVIIKCVESGSSIALGPQGLSELSALEIVRLMSSVNSLDNLIDFLVLLIQWNILQIFYCGLFFFLF